MSGIGESAPRGFHPPQQERSRATLREILRSTEELLKDKPFEEISVDEIVERAGTSKGAFYTRFDGKESLLEVLRGDRYRDVLRDWDAFLDPMRWAGEPVEAFVRAFADRVVRIYTDRRALMREFVRRARYERAPEVRARGRELNRRILDGVEGIVLAHRDRISHPEPERAVRLAFDMLGATARENLLFPESTLEDRIFGEDELARELARAFCAYLGVEGAL